MLYIEIKHNVRKCSWDKINVTKMHSFFNCELQLITVLLLILYELKHKAHLSKIVCGIFHFRLSLVFVKVYIFFNKKHELFDFKTS